MKIEKIIYNCYGEEIPKVKKRDIFWNRKRILSHGKIKLWRAFYRY